jgi:hypothetical protein
VLLLSPLSIWEYFVSPAFVLQCQKGEAVIEKELTLETLLKVMSVMLLVSVHDDHVLEH